MRRNMLRDPYYIDGLGAELIPIAGGKSNVKFYGQVNRDTGAKIDILQYVYATNGTYPLFIDGKPNTVYKIVNIAGIGTAGMFSTTINGMPVGRFVRMGYYIEFLLPDGRRVSSRSVEMRCEYLVNGINLSRPHIASRPQIDEIFNMSEEFE